MTSADRDERRAEDAALAERLVARDRGALEEAFKGHAGAVRGAALRVLRDASLAEDIVQECFVTLWRSPEKYDATKGTLRTFLITIAHRRAIDMVRSESARQRREDRMPPPAPHTIDDEVWSRALGETVREALADLNDGEREAITMAYYGGYSYVEVAERLRAPEGTVKSRIRSGMKKLSVALTGVT
jgi:RNA polymerase sigma-70 factor (ECF subfamily)